MPTDARDVRQLGGTLIGVVGGGWRGTVTPWGAVVPGDGSPVLDWWVAADDRWHTPAREPTCRQHRVEGAPVVETAIRIPGGDALQRVYAVGHAGGLTVVEVENRSPSPFAVAVTRTDLLTARSPIVVPPGSVDVPPGAVSLPVAHRSAIRYALAHDGRGAGRLPDELPTSDEVVRGWTTQTTTATRLELPVAGTVPWSSFLTANRSALLLGAVGGDEEEPAAFLVGCAQRARLEPSCVTARIDLVAAAAERLARRWRRAESLPWTVDAALAAAGEVLLAAGEDRAAADLRRARDRLPATGPTPLERPLDGPLALAWVERRVAIDRLDAVDLFPAPFPDDWLGQPVEAHRLPVAGGEVGVAVRWHGDRPALLWATDVPRRLRCSGLDPGWQARASSGEALLSPVPRAPR